MSDSKIISGADGMMTMKIMMILSSVGRMTTVEGGDNMFFEIFGKISFCIFLAGAGGFIYAKYQDHQLKKNGPDIEFKPDFDTDDEEGFD